MRPRSFFLAVLTTFYVAFAFGLLIVLDPRPISESREQFTYFFSLTILLGGAWLLARWLFTRFEAHVEALETHLFLLALWLAFSLWTGRVTANNNWVALSLGLGILWNGLALWFHARIARKYLILGVLANLILLFLLIQVFAVNYSLVTLLLSLLLLAYLRFPQAFLRVTAAAFSLACAVFLPVPVSSTAFAWVFGIGSVVLIAYAIGMVAFIEKFSEKYDLHLSSVPQRRFADAVALLLIVLSSFDLSLRYDTFHFSPYLTTINDILHGRSVLVDTFSIYGVSLNYFAALPFSLNLLPFSTYNFSFFVSLFTCIQFLLIYAILRLLTKSIRWSSLGILLIIIFQLYLTAMNRLNVAMLPIPQVGVLRFGWLYLLMAVAAWRGQKPAWAKILRGIEYVLIALISTWSLEALIFVLPAYMGMVAYESLQAPLSWGQRFRLVFIQMLQIIGMMLLGMAVFSLFTWWRAGQMPQVGVYLNYMLSLGYQSQNYQSSKDFLVIFWAPWAFIALIYGLYLNLVSHAYFQERRSLPAPLIGLILGGILGFYYWVGNSTIISAQVIIPLMLVVYGLYLLQKQVALRRVVNTAVLAAFLIIPLYYVIQVNYPIYSLPLALLNQVRGVTGPEILPLKQQEIIWQSAFLDGSVIHEDEVAGEIIDLVERHLSPEEPLIIFVQNEAMVTSLLYLERIMLFPLTGEFEDSMNPQALDYALQRSEVYLNQLTLGGKMITMRDWQTISLVNHVRQPLSVSRHLISRICERFGIQELEALESGIVVLELVAQSPATACENYWLMD